MQIIILNFFSNVFRLQQYYLKSDKEKYLKTYYSGPRLLTYKKFQL